MPTSSEPGAHVKNISSEEEKALVESLTTAINSWKEYVYEAEYREHYGGGDPHLSSADEDRDMKSRNDMYERWKREVKEAIARGPTGLWVQEGESGYPGFMQQHFKGDVVKF
ncbi:hypothetical protein TruAng_007896 [Truncatella angustata]|nr:hypothetical protein TruAng_007896 [Truncatella angustata]